MGYDLIPKNKDAGSPRGMAFKVTPSEAKAMAKLFRGYVSVKRAIREEWEKKTEEEKEILLSVNKRAAPPGEEFINKVEGLIDFCEQSGGFRIR